MINIGWTAGIYFSAGMFEMLLFTTKSGMVLESNQLAIQ
jgi:hypothetical protein